MTPPPLSRHSILARRISQHLRDFHNEDTSPDPAGGTSSRRRFLAEVATASGLVFWLPQAAHAGQGRGKSADPTPIPGGVSPLGIFIHHFPAQPTATPLEALNEPSQITDFKGFVGLNRIRGAGFGSGFANPLAFQADMGFMKGTFVAADGNLHQGVFGFI
jgi:hypothetical protein